MKQIILFFVFIITFFCNAQDKYPTDYFRSPLEIPIVLSGSFGELRSNHFHSGLDIKTQGKQGLKVITVADGYVSRINVKQYGYGKAIYVTHPNGFTSVYGHLSKFNDEIEAYVKSIQYKKENYTTGNLFLDKDKFQLKKGDILAYSGDTGGSGGPHLHFEIRDNQERPLNPLMFGFDIKDTTPPVIFGLYGYPLSEYSHIKGRTKRIKIRVSKQKDGSYKSDTINAYGKIGFGIVSTDRQDLASNNNGVNKIQTMYNNQKR